MELTEEPTRNGTHGVTLLRELNSQRRLGQFCDCVIQLNSHPGKVFLAHKSVLAVFSPVLASLLPRHGTLMDVNFPNFTPETLDNLLEYIYTGSLPPQSQEESVLSAAVHLQMEQLQVALRFREKATGEITVPVQDKLSQKRRFVDRQSVDENPPVSPPHYPYGSDRPTPSPLTYEVVPVICHVKASGNNKLPCNRNPAVDGEREGPLVRAKEPARHGNRRSPRRLEKSFSLDHVPETQDKVLTAQSESSLNEPPSVLSGEVSGRHGDIGQLLSMLSENPSNDDSKDHHLESRSTITEDLAPGAEYHQTSNSTCPQFNRCQSNCYSGRILDINSIKSFNSFDSGNGDHFVEMFSGTFNDKNSYNITGKGPTDSSHCCGQFSTNSCEVPLCLEKSSSPDTSENTCGKQTSDVWSEVGQVCRQKSTAESKPSDMGAAEKNAVEETLESVDHADSFKTLVARRNKAIVYQSQVRYYCLPERPRPAISDSGESDDSDGGQPNPLRHPPDAALEAEPALGQRSKPRPFQCSLCERPFSQRGSLNRHVRSHLGVRPYSCPRCAMTFSRQYRVTEHMRVHLRNYEGPAGP